MRPKILVNWDYDRNDLMIPFLKLEHDFEFIFIYKYQRVDESNSFPFKTIYWNEYKTPYKLLREIKPAKIIFHDIESFHQVALCIAAKNKKVITFHLEHGVKFELKNHLDEVNYLKTIKAKENKNEPKTTNSFQTLLFYLSSFPAKQLSQLYNWIKFMYVRKTMNMLEGLVACPFPFRKADLYINFTKFNARF